MNTNDGIPRTGAPSPAGMEWQMGKTAEVIKFVNDAEAYLASLPNARFAFDTEIQMAQTHDELRNFILAMKSGECRILGWLTVEEFLAAVSGKE